MTFRELKFDLTNSVRPGFGMHGLTNDSRHSTSIRLSG